MSMDLSFHNVIAITAKAGHANAKDVHWLDVIITTAKRGQATKHEMTFYLEGPDAGQRADDLARAMTTGPGNPPSNVVSLHGELVT